MPLSALAPLALIYAAGSALHRRFGFRSRVPDRRHLLPLIVVGSLRAGGAGKTAVTMELARLLAREGRKVGILAYWLCKPRAGDEAGLETLAPGLAEVFPDSDWRGCSDEAVMMARRGGMRVFVTRYRERAWDFLSRRGGLDVLISDDGLMDPTLVKGALRLVLRTPGENPGPTDLLPAGPYRMTMAASAADFRVEGPLAPGDPESPGRLWFSRELVLPDGLDGTVPCFAACGVGNPEGFRRALEASGLQVGGMIAAPDHGLPDARRVRAGRERLGAPAALCTEKDWVKMQGREEFGPVAVVRERIRLGEGVLETVRRFLPAPPTS